MVQVGGKLLVATTGGSPLKPSEVALLEVDSVEALRASTPEQWQVLQRSSKAQVRANLADAAVSSDVQDVPHRAKYHSERILAGAASEFLGPPIGVNQS